MRRPFVIFFVGATCLLLAGALFPPGALAVDPAVMGSCELPYAATDVVLAGTHAYVADGAGGLLIVDISDRTAPAITGSIDLFPGGAREVAVAGSYAYVAAGGPGLKVVNVSNPAAPVVVGGCAIGEGALGVAVSGSHVYVVGYAGLSVVDVSVPAAPHIIGFCDLPFQAQAWGVTVAGTHAYVSNLDGGLQVVDVSNPAAPVVTGSCDLFSSMDVTVAGNSAYVADGPAGFRIVDVTNPASPILRGSLDAADGDATYDVAVLGLHAYIAESVSWNQAGRLRVVDVSDPALPVTTGSCDLPSEAVGVAVNDDAAYIAARSLYVVDLTPAHLAGVTPGHGLVGANVVISGNDLGASGTVRFGATVASTSAWSDTSITCSVPEGVTAGATSVTVAPEGGAASNGLAFTVDGATLTSLTPDHGWPGATVVIAGVGMGTSGSVRFGATPAATSAWSDTSITCTVPSSLVTGATGVTVTPTGGATSNTLSFSVDFVGAAGILDTSFGAGGKVVTNLTSGSDWAAGTALQSDGKIVVAGGAASGKKFVVARYNADGGLDTTFSGDGWTFVDFTSGYDYANCLAMQDDGKIVVVGGANYGQKTNAKFAVARLNSDGTLDTSFSGDGKVTTDFTGKEDFANGVVIQLDGKIVVDGPSGVFGTNPKFALARYNPDGSLDTSFSGDGKVTTDFTRWTDWASGSALQGDGKIIVTGIAGALGTNPKFALARYNSDGSLDRSFSGDGKATTDFTASWDQALAVAVQADGRIVAAGIAGQHQTNSKFALARYTSTGTLDTSFSGDGKVTTDFTSKKDEAYCLAIQADGKIVVGGDAGYSSANSTFGLARYNTDGTLDMSFSDDGRVTTDFTPRDDFVTGLAIQSDGMIVAAGEAGLGGSADSIALARYK